MIELCKETLYLLSTFLARELEVAAAKKGSVREDRKGNPRVWFDKKERKPYPPNPSISIGVDDNSKVELKTSQRAKVLLNQEKSSVVS